MIKLSDLGKYQIVVGDNGRLMTVGKLIELIQLKDTRVITSLLKNRWYLLECINGEMISEFEVDIRE